MGNTFRLAYIHNEYCWNVHLNTPCSCETASFRPSSDQNLEIITFVLGRCSCHLVLWCDSYSFASVRCCSVGCQRSRESWNHQHFSFHSSKVLLYPGSCAAVVGEWESLCFATKDLRFWFTYWKSCSPGSMSDSYAQKRWQLLLSINVYIHKFYR